jgi:hypothetical protein
VSEPAAAEPAAAGAADRRDPVAASGAPGAGSGGAEPASGPEAEPAPDGDGSGAAAEGSGTQPDSRRNSLIAITLALALAIGGILVGVLLGGGRSPTQAELGQRRAHLAFVARGLRSVEPRVRHELATARAAWPAIAHGLPSSPAEGVLAKVQAAMEAVEAVPPPRFVSLIGELAGPAISIAQLFRFSQALVTAGWQHVESALSASAGTPAARFARANSSLYIESIYQGMFKLSEIGPRLQAAYLQLGGAQLFGTKLTHARIRSIAGTYGPSDKLKPHAVLRPASS